MDFRKLCTFESFQQVWSHYGYEANLQDVIEQQFTRIKGVTYLDHAAAALYPECALRDSCQDMSRNLYGNPHSHSPSSRLTHDTVERVRYRVLQHFNTTPEEYSVVFTSGCTAALKLVTESFPWRPQTKSEAGSRFCYLTDSHTSVVGIRGLTSAWGVVALSVSPQEVESRAKHEVQSGGCIDQTPHLFCYPAQSNFSGRKYPLSHVIGIQARRLYPACDHQGRWFVLLDAASHVSCSPLNLKECPADFIPISFYKMFGFPTGLGALLVRNHAAGILKKTYFGGGTAAAYLSGEDYYVQAANISDRFEDGTVAFLDVVALNHSFEALYRITGNMHNIQQHTFGLARYTYVVLSSLCHGNGRPVAQIYTEGQFESPGTQGPILNFNLVDSHGQIVGYSQVDRMASLYNIHIRTGCFCNTGSCQSYLGITDQQMKRNLQAGHVCGDSMDLVDGQPTGSVRVSFGYISTFEDCQKFLNFVAECFVEKPVTVDQATLGKLHAATATTQSPNEGPPIEMTNGEIYKVEEKEKQPEPSLKGFGQRDSNSHREAYTLTNIYIYPIKSCGAFEVHDWPVGPLGLLYDRGWMVVNGNGVCLSQKREARLCLVRPQVHLPSNKLLLQASSMDTISIPLENNTQMHTSYEVSQSKVCSDRVETVDCGDEAASWLSEFLGQPCRLIRQSPDFTRDMKKKPVGASTSTFLSLVNEAQYLMINRASVELIQKLISSRQDCSEGDQLLDTQNVISRFRANLVIAGEEPFEEDNWSHLIIGNTQFVVAGPCGRCQMVGIDQDTGTKTKEPLTSLSAHCTGKDVSSAMKRRVDKRGEAASTARGVHSTEGARQKQGATSRWSLKRGLLVLFMVLILFPFSVKIPQLIQHFVYTYRISLPFFTDLSQPADFSLNHTINMYLTSEKGISLGVWHTVPASQWKEAQGKDLTWYQNSLNDGNPVFIYLHGNTNTRSAPHRVGVAKVLSALGYHVVVPDYRGFGDSTGEPTEKGFTTDAIFIYNWVKARSGNSLVVIWGHSLGTGVTTNTAVELIKQGVVFDGVILEGTFNIAGVKMLINPFAWYYWRLPGSGYLFPEPWEGNDFVFPTLENLKKMKNPILFLHSKDDHIASIESVQQLYEVAVKAQNAERVKLVTFDGSLGYLHNGLYRDPHLPDIIKSFVDTL